MWGNECQVEMSTLLKSRNVIPVLVLLVFLLFLFPVKVGSFQSTHGPTSTLEKSLVGVLFCSLLMVIAALVPPTLSAVRRIGVLVWRKSLGSAHAIACPVSLRC